LLHETKPNKVASIHRGTASCTREHGHTCHHNWIHAAEAKNLELPLTLLELQLADHFAAHRSYVPTSTSQMC
jgi:hypothetical protein